MEIKEKHVVIIDKTNWQIRINKTHHLKWQLFFLIKNRHIIKRDKIELIYLISFNIFKQVINSIMFQDLYNPPYNLMSV
jgi:hypothetical protein